MILRDPAQPGESRAARKCGAICFVFSLESFNLLFRGKRFRFNHVQLTELPMKCGRKVTKCEKRLSIVFYVNAKLFY